ncbi:hypothetical protein FSP39_016747, partial [Pinctada imbricata]
IKGECIGEMKGIDYDKLRCCKAFEDYKSDTFLLHKVKLDNMSETEIKAFFINLYNALTIHGIAAMQNLPTSVLDVHKFWQTTAYNIDGHTFTLDDIEHGILRGNRSHPASTSPQFSEKDPRLKFVLKHLDPRIHFALVCGAVSCPVINVYTPTNLDKALDAAAKNFCTQEVSMFTEVDEVWLSKIFLWYRDDFGSTEVDVIKWTIPFLSPEKQDRAWVLVFKLENVGKVDVKYNEYDWRLNKLGVNPIIL